jgi:hypothetical protein
VKLHLLPRSAEVHNNFNGICFHVLDGMTLGQGELYLNHQRSKAVYSQVEGKILVFNLLRYHVPIRVRDGSVSKAARVRDRGVNCFRRDAHTGCVTQWEPC